MTEYRLYVEHTAPEFRVHIRMVTPTNTERIVTSPENTRDVDGYVRRLGFALTPEQHNHVDAWGILTTVIRITPTTQGEPA